MSADNETAIQVTNLSKMFKLYSRPADMFWELMRGKTRYKPFWALRDISFEVKRGKVVGLIGRNGAGKSTLLKILTGTLDKTDGEVIVNGRVSSILELGTGFTGAATGRENIYLGGLMVGLAHDEIMGKMDWIIEFSELADFIDQPFKTYSTGMQARLTFATAVCIDPDILIVDEALSVGDAKFQRKSFGKIEEFRKAGHTIVLVSHDVNTISTFCDHAILLEGGQIFDQGEPHRIGQVYYKMLFATDDAECSEAVDEHRADTADEGETPPAAEIPLDPDTVVHDGGKAWTVGLGDRAGEGDSLEKPHCSAYVLCEDDLPLGPAHCGHEQVRLTGGGAFSHWGRQLYFSTSDNSDPRTNGWRYCLKHESTLGNVQSLQRNSIQDGVDLHHLDDRETLRKQALKKLGLREAFLQDNPHQTRMGNRKAEILDFGIWDEKGNRTTVLMSGMQYTFFMRALFCEDVSGYSVGFLIRNVKGIDLFGASTLTQQMAITPQRRGDLFEFNLKVTMWLTNGVYFLSFGIADPFADRDVQYDLRYDALQFEVMNKTGIFTTSIVDLDAKLTSTNLN